MKKLLLALLFGCVGMANADPLQTIVRSSHTETADTGVLLTSAGVNYSAISLVGIVIDKPAVGWISIFNSSWTTTPLVSSISLNSANPTTLDFHDLSLAALSYTKTGTTPLTILYRKR